MTRLALALVVLLVAPLAHAQDTSTLEARARTEFHAGELAYDEERYAEALEHFLRAQQIDPHDVVRFNVAICLQRLGRWSDAWREYRSLTTSDALDEAQRAYAAELLADLESRLAVVRVTTSEPAEIRIDGDPQGPAPLEARLAPGPHVLTARAGDRESIHRVTVERGQQLDVALSLPAPAAIAPPEHRATRTVLRDPSWLTYVGAGIAAIGIGGTIGLGVHAQSLWDAYHTPGQATHALRDEGMLATDLTNVSIGVAALGAVLVAIDVILLLTGEGARTVEIDRP
ncbi:tetratricopeptide repeat protein [Sandaracinus amylolyticus]|uniref:tetratricopeptide repeat protein n=1 Tax=Sandaracinus amylolyticus TaxID=927083 RepID=UPI001F245F42|nr:tetratricopeptide repeat protein [Sandaracinus amylolyticus]UJR86274.1 Hypothetical protein I5071_83560 [Sandaracinus amylolyticus]